MFAALVSPDSWDAACAVAEGFDPVFFYGEVPTVVRLYDVVLKKDEVLVRDTVPFPVLPVVVVFPYDFAVDFVDPGGHFAFDAIGFGDAKVGDNFVSVLEHSLGGDDLKTGADAVANAVNFFVHASVC